MGVRAHMDMSRGSFKCCLLTSRYQKGPQGIQPPVQHTHAEDRTGHSYCVGLCEPPGGHLQLRHTETGTPHESCSARACHGLATPDLLHPQQPRRMSPPYTCAQAPQPATLRGRGWLAPDDSITSQLGGSGQGTPLLGKVTLSLFGTTSSSSSLRF